jgi:hypothetical protein
MEVESMSGIRLKDLLNKIIDEMDNNYFKETYEKRAFLFDFILKRIQFYGDGNEHIPLLVGEERSENDNNLLTGDEIVFGKYLVYSCCGHDGTEHLKACKNLNEIEDYIKQFYDNPFINEIIVIVDSEVKKYEVYGEPNEIIEVNFDEPDEENCSGYIKEIINRKVRWI